MRNWTDILWLILLAALLSAHNPRTALCQSNPKGIAFFEKNIRPLLISKCYKCHSKKSGKRSGGLLLDSRKGWQQGGDSGRAIVPRDANASLLIRAVRYADDNLRMPPKKRLTKQQVALLEAWIKIGAPDPRTVTAGKVRPSGAKPSDPVAGKKHWAFRPLARVRSPRVRDSSWPRTQLDTFVLEQLEMRNLRPAADARPIALLRRLHIQLTGLQPTPKELASFANDSRVDGLERVVDRLLGSPQFGERWGRHWLDLARYADSNGLDENFLFRQAWRYRNWVLDAVNADTPYDSFLEHQIAGDLLPFASIEQRDRQRLGTGFLVIGPKVLLGVPGARQKMEIADEQIDTIGRAVLAQTLGCARCHDHKFDPFPTADYYALAGILTSTKVMEQRQMLGSRRYMEHLVGLGKQGPQLDDIYEAYWAELPKLKTRIKAAQSVLKRLKNGQQLPADTAKNGAIAATAGDAKRPKAARIAAQKNLIDRLSKKVAKKPSKPPRAMVALEGKKPADEHIRLAGEYNRLGKRVGRGFLQVLRNGKQKSTIKGSGRAELARWLVDARQGAGHLTARVIVNRIWHHLIGRGLVRTVDDFGRRGETPSHPKLLDYLAQRLIESDWSIKRVVREIVLSRTFAMSSAHNERGYGLDAENRWLWRANRRRLDPESLRDNMLHVARQLDLKRMGSTVDYLGDQATGVGAGTRRRTDYLCRSVYLPVVRNDLPELFEVFNFANPHTTTGARPQTTVATQGLFMLNDGQVQNAAKEIAKGLLKRKAGQRVDVAYRLIFCATPTAKERRRLMAFVVAAKRQLDPQNKSKSTKLSAWTLACHAMLASSRFQFVE